MNTPKIRFKGFEDDWEQRKFEDVGTVAMCKRIFKEQTSEEGEVPFYKIGTFGGIPDAYITRELFEEYKKNYQYPNKGDILISASGSIGRTVEYTGKDEYYQDSNIVWLKHENDLDNSFLKVLYGVIEWSCEGSTIKRLYNYNFLKTEFMLPKIEEQIKIGEYFSKLDHLITLHQRKCDETKQLKKFMLQKMFPKNGEKNPEIRFEGFTDDWEQRKLGDICEQLSQTIDPKRTPNARFEEYSMPAFDQNMKATVVEGSTMNSTRKIISKECLLINKLNVRKKRIWLVEKPSDNAVCSAEFIPICSDEINLRYLKYFTLNDSFTKYLEDCSSGSSNSQKRVTPDIIMNAEIIAPVYAEQKKIGDYFRNLDHLITLHQRKCEKLKELKKFMLQNMFV